MSKKITVYSTPTCPFCHAVKDHLKSLGVGYTEYNVAEDEAKATEMFEKTGQMGVPVTEIEYPDRKSEFVVGFDQAQLSYMLGI